MIDVDIAAGLVDVPLNRPLLLRKDGLCLGQHGCFICRNNIVQLANDRFASLSIGKRSASQGPDESSRIIEPVPMECPERWGKRGLVKQTGDDGLFECDGRAPLELHKVRGGRVLGPGEQKDILIGNGLA